MSQPTENQPTPTMDYQPRPPSEPPPATSLRDFFAQMGNLSRGEQGALLRADQRQRWQRGNLIRVEAYLEQIPELLGEEAVVLDLIHNEVVLREDRGEEPKVEEYLQRFPQFTFQLQRQFALHRALRWHSMLRPADQVASPTEPPGAPPAPQPLEESGKTVLVAAVETGRPPGMDVARPSLDRLDLPGYDILSELGRGGMGVVYKARHRALNRVVALKMILSGQHAGAEEIARFRMEAEAVARLQHPNIVQIYEIGDHGGLPFFSLEYIDGGSLEDKLAGKPMPYKEAARLMEILARAMHWAHQHHIIHRDLKPANVLLTSEAVPKITDFGLAKKLDSQMAHTQTGAVMGTPNYMAPEQAAGKTREIGPGTDVYALGAILYELLTGRPPFVGETPLDTLLQVRYDEPVPPQRLHAKLPRDLEIICLKSLNKEPKRRYASAGELADDLQRFLADEPILARPTAAWERALKWVRRRPTLAAVLGVSILAAIGLLIAGGIYHANLQTAYSRISEEQSKVMAANQSLSREQDKVKQELIRLKVAQGTQYVNSGYLLRSLPWFVDALGLDQARPERERLHRLRLGSILRQCPRFVRVWAHEGQQGRVTFADFSPNGQWVVTTSDDGTAWVWDLKSGEKVVGPLKHQDQINHAAFGSDGKLLATSSDDHTAQLWNLGTGQPHGSPLKHGEMVLQASFSPDGKRVVTASADNTARIWDTTTGMPITDASTLAHKGRVNSAVFSPNGRHVLTASADVTARVWDASTGKPTSETVLKHDGEVNGAAYSTPDGDRIVTAGTDGKARLWEAGTMRQLAELAHGTGSSVLHAGFSLDGQLIVTCSDDNTARVWDGRTGIARTGHLRHTSTVYHGSFSVDGTRVATASDDNLACVWDTATGELVDSPLRHNGTVYRAVGCPDRRYPLVLTACSDGTARVWIGSPGITRLPAFEHTGRVTQVNFSPDGKRILTASADGMARLWDAATGRALGEVMRHGGPVNRAMFSSDGRRVVTASDDHTARVWDALTGMPVGEPLRHRQPVLDASFSPDGRWIVTADGAHHVGQARVWDAGSGAPVSRPLVHGSKVTRVVFNSDGLRVATASADKTARVWDPRTGEAVTPPLKHMREVRDVVFSPEGKCLATASEDRTAQVWDAGTGKPITEPLPHASKVYGVCFAPDGKRLATAADDNAARIWETASGKLMVAPLRHGGTIYRVTFSPDGCCLLTASEDNTARVWESATGELLAPPLKHRAGVLDAVFSSDGLRVLTGSSDQTARVWDLHEAKVSLDDLQLIAKVLAGGWIDEIGGLVPFDEGQLRRNWQQLRERYPKEFSVMEKSP